MSLAPRFALALMVALAPAAYAQPPVRPASGSDHAAHHLGASAAPLSDGEVRKIDKSQGKITLRHGPIAQLDMPAMTMVFRTADPKLLDGLNEGDKVRFAVARINGAFTVTAIQTVK